MANKYIWIKNGLRYSLAEPTIQLLGGLPKKVYNVQQNSKGEFSLVELEDEFTFGFKLYGMETEFIDHVLSTYEKTSSSLGVLLNGTKGTGKTVCAKIIANRLNLPVLLINSPYPGLSDFISSMECPCVLFFDEFEKNFDTNRKQDLELLSIMDGVFNSQHRRVFLLTTNRLHINENLIGRPSRIRYCKTFGNLSSDVVKEYLNDHLKNKDFEAGILDFVDTLAISTIDILKSIVEEVNIHNAPIESFRSFFNVEKAKYSYKILCRLVDLAKQDNAMLEFKNDIAKASVLIKEGKTAEYRKLNIFRQTVSMSTDIAYATVGDEFSSYGSVIEGPDADGFMMCEKPDGDKFTIKVLNISSKPSLYRGQLYGSEAYRPPVTDDYIPFD